MTSPRRQEALVERLLEDAQQAIEQGERMRALTFLTAAIDTAPRSGPLWMRLRALQDKLQPIVVEAPLAVTALPVLPILSQEGFVEIQRPALYADDIPANIHEPLQDSLKDHEQEEADAFLSVTPATEDEEQAEVLTTRAIGVKPSAGMTGSKKQSTSERPLAVREMSKKKAKSSPYRFVLIIVLLGGWGWWYMQPAQREQREVLTSYLPANLRDRLASAMPAKTESAGLAEAKAAADRGDQEEAYRLAEAVASLNPDQAGAWMLMLDNSPNPADRNLWLVVERGSRSAEVDLKLADIWLRAKDTVSAARLAGNAFAHGANPEQAVRILQIFEMTGDTDAANRVRPYLPSSMQTSPDTLKTPEAGVIQGGQPSQPAASRRITP